MDTHTRKHWFITGVSTGLGRDLAIAALERGDFVAGTVRQTAQLADFERLAPGRALAFLLDVTDRAQVAKVVEAAHRALGHLDVVVNNAGYGSMGAVEEVSRGEIERQFDVNVFGALDVSRAVLPHFRADGGGHLVQISSVAGVVGFPGAGIYNASKFALEGFSEAIATEAKHLGVRVTIVEPGPFRTDWAGRSLTVADSIADYEPSSGKQKRAITDLDGRQAGDPKRAALAILKAVDHEDPPLRLVLGRSALAAIRAKLDQTQAELDAWEPVTLGTDFPATL